jgi:hypothetical protein
MKVVDELLQSWYLPMVGKIKTGMKVSKDGVTRPQKFDHFVILSVAKDGKFENKVHEIFNTLYSKKQALPITFPSDNIKDIFSVHYGVFAGSTRICFGDGETYKRDIKGQQSTGVCDYKNCEFGKQHKCKMNMTLKVLLRNPEHNTVYSGGYFVFNSSGFKTIDTIAKNLKMAKDIYGYLAGLPAFLIMENDSAKLEKDGKEFITRYYYERIEIEVPLDNIKGKTLIKNNYNNDSNPFEADEVESKNYPPKNNPYQTSSQVQKERSVNRVANPAANKKVVNQDTDFDLPIFEDDPFADIDEIE